MLNVPGNINLNVLNIVNYCILSIFEVLMLIFG